MADSTSAGGLGARLKRDLGTLESYAAMVGMLVGAGIFRVTSDATALTGPSVVLGYLVLAPAIFATSVAYIVFLSTPLGLLPGGEYTTLSRTFGSPRLAFLGAWLKLVSYLGASTYLATALAGYLLHASLLGGVLEHPEAWTKPVAFGGLLFFYLVHITGVRWFGRLQVAMCAVLGVSILVLVVPGLFAIDVANYRPFFTGGMGGFAAALAPLFFAYAGFESLAHAASEVKDSQQRLPRIFLRGITLATVIFLAMSAVAFGVLPAGRIQNAEAPMAEAAAAYLPHGAAAFVTIGGLFAVLTSLNATMFVPARLGVMLAEDGLLPKWLGTVHAERGTPVAGLTVTFGLAALLLWSGMIGLALEIAIFSLVALYCLHSVALLLLPRLNPELAAEVTSPIPRRVQVGAGLVSVLSMGGILAVMLKGNIETLMTTGFVERWNPDALAPTTIELMVVWGALGLLLHFVCRRGQ